jgi:hypothetical protein
MPLYYYRLPYATMIALMKMVDIGQLKIVGLPKRNESSEVQRFIKDYIAYKSK